MGNGQKSSLPERLYITGRRIKALAQSLAYYACRIFPVDRDKIVMWTFECGGGYGCSPKYIAEEILRRNREKGTAYQIVWLLNDTGKEFPKEIKKAKSSLWSRAYHMSTAGTWVSNTRSFYGTRKRKGQCYIQTWHATICIKPIGKYRGEQFPRMAYLASKADSKLIDYVLSGADWCSAMYREGLLYEGEIVRTGTPRCDVLFGKREEKQEQMREKYHIPQDAKILLYAPTFRGGSQGGKRSVSTEEADIDLGRLTEALEKRFGGSWYIFMRLHPQLATKMKGMKIHKESERLVDVSQEPDMNEIIAGTDAFLTDYSSAIFEAALIKQPAFIYADDLEDYIAERGKLFFDMYQLPFPVAEDEEVLIENILGFDENDYREKLEVFMKSVGVFEDGRASERIVDLIIKR